ncbi:MAG: FtsW/RodA/SpoVE family cell cycle protein, partial [Bacilli bacterium]
AVSFEKLMKVRNISIPKKFFPFAIPMVFTMLIFMQPDLGTMIILLGILFVIFCILPIDFKQKSVVAGLALICGLSVLCVMLITGKGFGEVQKQRLNFKEPCTRYRQETGYQVCNGFIAMNSGGLFGSGFGNSKQKYLYLPEAHTDFIFPIIIEETGLITGIIILIVYFIIIWRIIMIGRKSYNLQGMIISYGVAAYISLHIIVNLVGVMGLLPLTGVPLPFYSYGGSFMINLLICLSLVQRVCVENKQFEQKHLVR